LQKEQDIGLFFSLTPAIQSVQTAIVAHPNHDAIASAKIISRPPGANSPKNGFLARHRRSTDTAAESHAGGLIMPSSRRRKKKSAAAELTLAGQCETTYSELLVRRRASTMHFSISMPRFGSILLASKDFAGSL
jgi:hypothetical protein